MRGILADNNCQGQFDFLVQLLRSGYRLELWEALEVDIREFVDVELQPESSDAEIWHVCQREELVLITANRSADGADSLERTIRDHNHSTCLPVVTISDSDRVVYDRNYAERSADRLLEILFEIENYRGTGRLFIP